MNSPSAHTLFAGSLLAGASLLLLAACEDKRATPAAPDVASSAARSSGSAARAATSAKTPATTTASAAADAGPPEIAESRALIKRFGSALKKELVEGMKAGGPKAALAACHTKAPGIAGALKAPEGWSLRRVSLKPRNADNAPDAWEKKQLEAFESQRKEGADVATLEHSEVMKAEGKETFRYLKAIPTGGLCLSCHGSKLAPELSAEIKRLYPKDQATGFALGDIRGAFSISKVR